MQTIPAMPSRRNDGEAGRLVGRWHLRQSSGPVHLHALKSMRRNPEGSMHQIRVLSLVQPLPLSLLLYLLRPAMYVFCKPFVRLCALAPPIVVGDRLPMAWRLCKPHIPRYHDIEHLITKMPLNFFFYLIR